VLPSRVLARTPSVENVASTLPPWPYSAAHAGGMLELSVIDDGRGGFAPSDVNAPSPYETTCSGIFAVGDVRAGSVKRVASSVGEGSVVISRVWAHVNRTV